MKKEKGWNPKQRMMVTTMVVLIMFAGLLGVCAGPAEAEQAVLKIGFISPLSGPAMTWGYIYYSALDLLVDEVNAKGGLKVGDTTYQLKMIAYDSKAVPDAAVTAAKRLIFEDKVKIIFGEMISANVLAMKPITEANKVILFADGYSEKLMQPPIKYYFRSCITHVEYYPMLIDHYKEWQPGLKSMAYVYLNTETGLSMSKWMKKYGEEKGLDIRLFEYEAGIKDLSPVVTKVLATNPDMIDMDGGPPGDATQIINLARDAGYTKPIRKGGGGDPEEYIRVCGAKANGVTSIEIGWMDDPNPKIQELYRRWEAKKYPTPKPSGLAGITDVLNVLLKALQKAGTVDDTDKIAKAMEETEYDGLTGHLSWTGMKIYGFNRSLACPVYLSEIKDGKPVVIKKIEVR